LILFDICDTFFGQTVGLMILSIGPTLLLSSSGLLYVAVSRPPHHPLICSFRKQAIKESIGDGEDPRLSSFPSPGPQVQGDEEAIC
jgi:hypothetical protein